ncbi:proline-rich receptor-like protein kinase PERK8 [Cinnamomum micranthum f. kanehirae]|uniref:Proline-rich receptor-like protein kinase PERK8 n=1 Tax=Cinnamomum micranthum f. kanehirae TaxID=337451 RepID=A0A3S3N1G4_9MAGN|nr:proline-rich receptor-like protein kinase PERK8 [Cinnamomum micranthum f. kanehirae]
MGCSHMGNMISSALKRLRGKGKIKRSRKAHNPGSEDKLARSVSQSNNNPIYITHSSDEIITTLDPPQKPPDTPAPQLIHPTPDTSTHTMTKQVVQVHYVDPNDKSPPDHFGPKDPYYSRHETGFARYRYNDSSVTGREYEESSSSSNHNKAEYLCGEYQYYPTPAHEGIYNLATDGNHLTSIFSDENPNACTIA